MAATQILALFVTQIPVFSIDTTDQLYGYIKGDRTGQPYITILDA